MGVCAFAGRRKLDKYFIIVQNSIGESGGYVQQSSGRAGTYIEGDAGGSRTYV